MDRLKWIGSLVVAGLLMGAGVAVAQTPTPPPPPPSVPQLGAQLETCLTSPLPVGRVAAFVGSMPAMTGATRMQMRFDLQRRRPTERHWRPVTALQGFGIWETSMPDRAGFVFHKRVDGLQVPASYRARVRFRWFGAGGTLLRHVRRVTPACVQRDLRPDLVPRSLRATLGALPGLAIYTVVVRNDGHSPAGAFAVRVAGGLTEVAGLQPDEQVEVTVLAPACVPGTLLRAVADADRRVDESDEHNGLRRTCPLAG